MSDTIPDPIAKLRAIHEANLKRMEDRRAAGTMGDAEKRRKIKQEREQKVGDRYKRARTRMSRRVN